MTFQTSEYVESPLSSPAWYAKLNIWQLIPSSPSSFLRAGSRFHGTQQSERQVYDVQVEIKHVDMRESFLCGYLRIQGKTKYTGMLWIPSADCAFLQAWPKTIQHLQPILKGRSLGRNTPSSPNIKTGVHRIRLISRTGPNSRPFALSKSKLGRAISTSLAWRSEKIFSCVGRSTSWSRITGYGRLVAQVLKAFTTSASTRSKVLLAEYISMQRAKSM